MLGADVTMMEFMKTPMLEMRMVSSNKISLLTVIVNNKNNSKTSNQQQKRKLIGEKTYWNQPYCSRTPV
jgi:dethiobiotin synthetase